MHGERLAHAENEPRNLRMNSGDCDCIWQSNDWPNWRFDLAALAGPMAEVSRAQGLLMGRLADVGLALRDQARLAALTEDGNGRIARAIGDLLLARADGSPQRALPPRMPEEQRAQITNNEGMECTNPRMKNERRPDSVDEAWNPSSSDRPMTLIRRVGSDFEVRDECG